MRSKPMTPEPNTDRLAAIVAELAPLAVAVSGGVDSMTLAVVAGRALGGRAEMVHAVSPAVPPEATARVRRYAEAEGWRLVLVDAGEFDDPTYRANPANRCFYCKTALYDTIAAHTRAQIASGTNLDDLDDWRPGLDAAARHGVRHPFVEAGIEKAGVRSLARALGLADLADLPAAPCLSSRVETGLRIEPDTLALVHAVERYVARRIRPATVRCRVRRAGLVIELDPATLDGLDAAARTALHDAVDGMARREGARGPISFAPYRMGGAFLREVAGTP